MKADFYVGIIVVDLKAAGGSPLVAYSSQLLKIVVEHSRMTNQTHLLFGFFGVGSDNCAAPRANYVLVWPRVIQTFINKVVLTTQHHHLPDCSLRSILHTHSNV